MSRHPGLDHAGLASQQRSSRRARRRAGAGLLSRSAWGIGGPTSKGLQVHAHAVKGMQRIAKKISPERE